MAGKGAEPKQDLTPEERQAVFGLLQRGTYRGSGLRAAAALVSSLRGADKALTDRAKAKRSVSPRWVKRQLAKCGIDASAALMGIAQRRAKVRRTEPEASHSASRTTRPGYSGVDGRSETEGGSRTPQKAEGAPVFVPPVEKEQSPRVVA